MNNFNFTPLRMAPESEPAPRPRQFPRAVLGEIRKLKKCHRWTDGHLYTHGVVVEIHRQYVVVNLFDPATRFVALNACDRPARVEKRWAELVASHG